MTKRYKSDAMAAIHETMESLNEIGAVDKQTMHRFDETCLTAIRNLTPEEIRIIREKEHVSQAVFSHYLNVTTGLISQWERGEKKPSGPSLKLLLIVDKKGLSAIV
ncbi:MAG: DNA-binding transcriptional regulator [Alphaproteobacteria bacterium]